jgi:hypothetical protein
MNSQVSDSFAAPRLGLEPLTSEIAGYAMVKAGPPICAEEVETENLSVIELIVLWGTTVLHVSHLTTPCSYYVGEETSRGKDGCDYYVPSELIGTSRAPIVVGRGGGASLVLLPRARGYVDIPGCGRMSFSALIASGRATRSPDANGAYELELAPGTTAWMQFEGSQLAFQIGVVPSGKKVPGGLLASSESDALLYTGMSFLLHLGLVVAFAFFMPTMRGDESEDLDRDRILMMQKLLNASANPEQQERDIQEATASPSTQDEGGRGARARGAEGVLGDRNAKPARMRYGVQGPRDNPDPHLARQAALDEAASWTTIGVLASLSGGDPRAPTVPWGRESSLGQDDRSALGNMFGDAIGTSFGSGLGLSGMDEGGGGFGDVIGIGNFGPLGNGAGPGPDQGIGAGRGRPRPSHTPKAPRLVQGDVQAGGRLPAEIIQRIVRMNFGRFRLCYENGARGNPSLQGRVTVKFLIDRTGAVSMAADGGSDLPDQNVVQCVVRSFSNLSFPQPDNGVVTVVYPILFSPGE